MHPVRSSCLLQSGPAGLAVAVGLPLTCPPVPVHMPRQCVLLCSQSVGCISPICFMVWRQGAGHTWCAALHSALCLAGEPWCPWCTVSMLECTVCCQGRGGCRCVDNSGLRQSLILGDQAVVEPWVHAVIKPIGVEHAFVTVRCITCTSFLCRHMESMGPCSAQR